MKAKFYVLMFHGIVKKKPDYFLYRPSANCFVREKDFEAIIHYCSRHYRFLKLADLDDYFNGTADKDGILVSFDDGLQSLYTLGMPVLKKYGAFATVFITPVWTSSQNEPAIFTLERRLYDHLPAKLEVVHKDFSFSREVGNSNLIAPVIGELWDSLSQQEIPPLSITHEQVLLNGIPLNGIGTAGETGDWTASSWEILAEMVATGLVETGAHGQTHTPLTWLNEEQLEQELVQSRQELEQRSGAAVAGCSFPHGMYNEKVLAAIDRNFTYGFANTIVSPPGHEQKKCIPRYNVPYQRPNNLSSLIRYPLLGKVLRKIGHITKAY